MFAWIGFGLPHLDANRGPGSSIERPKTRVINRIEIRTFIYFGNPGRIGQDDSRVVRSDSQARLEGIAVAKLVDFLPL